jgi:hypothetical protein
MKGDIRRELMWVSSDLHSRAVGELALANMREMVEAGKVSLRQAGGYSEAQISSLGTSIW